jgi:hypothetical protein
LWLVVIVNPAVFTEHRARYDTERGTVDYLYETRGASDDRGAEAGVMIGRRSVGTATKSIVRVWRGDQTGSCLS